jgi:4-carboxymuconolactone decarboxylase
VSASRTRIQPLPRDEWGADAIAALRSAFDESTADRLLATGPDAPRMPNAFTMLMRHPALAGPFLTYNNLLLRTPAIEPRLRELMVLRVAFRTRSPYEWLQHVRLAPRWGITAAEIDAIADGTGAHPWSPLEADLLTATDELLDHHRIDDETWRRIAQHLDERQLIEVPFIVGTYTCLAMAFNSFGLELDPELDTVAAPPLPGA